MKNFFQRLKRIIARILRTDNIFVILMVALLAALIAGFIILMIISLPLMWLWNWLMPEIFGLIEISIWQAMGLFLITGILFRFRPSNNQKPFKQETYHH